jgi:hypothetical protein
MGSNMSLVAGAALVFVRGRADSPDGFCDLCGDYLGHSCTPARYVQVRTRDEGGHTKILREVEYENSNSANWLLPILLPK